jgi:hypothetical protein
MSEPEEHVYYVGVDVGTSSVRAGLLSSVGRVLSFAAQDIQIRNPRHTCPLHSHPLVLFAETRWPQRWSCNLSFFLTIIYTAQLG